ncbi:hypothetical protein HMPREF0765_4339, partial [Sphingobacterium spiritivorum ATCC 33300]
YDPVNNKLIYKDEKGNENSLDISTLVKNNQTTTTVVAGTATSVTSSTVGNNTAYTINVTPATTTSTGAVKPGSGLSVAADGTLSVNTSGAGGIGKDFTSTDLNITGGTGATLTTVTANINDGVITPSKLANAGNNQVLITDGTGLPQWVNQNTLVPATTNTLVNNGTNTITSTVDGVTATAKVVNTVANSLSGSNLTTTVNGVPATALDLAPAIQNALKFANGTNATLTGNGTSTTPYKYDVATANGTTLGVVKEASANPTVNIATDGTLAVNTTNVATSLGKDVTAGSPKVILGGTPTGAVLKPFTIDVATADATTLGVVKEAANDPTVNIVNGELSVNPANVVTSLGKDVTAGSSKVILGGTPTGAVLKPFSVDVATANATTLGVVKEAATDPTVNIVNGELSVNPANVVTSLGKDVTAGSSKVILGGTPTGAVLKPFSVDVATANATTLGVVKEAATDPTVNIVNGELSVNPANVATSLGKTITTDGIIKVNTVNSLASSVLADAVLSIADGSITSTKITDATIVNADIANSTLTPEKIAIASSNQVLITGGTGIPQWIDQNKLEPWRVQGTSNGATTNTDNIYQTGNVAIGAGATALTGADANAKLYVNGTITTASSLYADYVFEDYLEGTSKLNSDYSFKSLDEVETFINENKHLPGVTGIKGLSKNEKGEYIFNISELSVQILEKVEELYLHTIEQKKQLDNKDREIETLKETVKNMNERLERIEKLYGTQPSHTK